MQNRIDNKVLLLNDRGELNQKGYATKMNFIYNREKARRFPLKLKEWNFYQIGIDKYVVQITIGHVSYMTSVSMALINLDTKDKYEIGAMKPLSIPKLDINPEENSIIEWENKYLKVSFVTNSENRVLTVKGTNKKYKDVEACLILKNDPKNEKMVIATPFKNKKQFYLNYKENYYEVEGFVKFDDLKISFDGASGLIDWGRGIWPYKHEWFWGNMSTFVDNVPFGFNIGWGFGDLSNATENMFFYNKKCYKLGKLDVKMNPDNYMEEWYVKDEEGLMELHFSPIHDNYTENKYVVIDTHCNQVFGYFNGYVITEEGRKEIVNKLAFIEHAVNKW